MRYELADYEWIAIKPMLPNKPRGVPRVNDRRVLNGIFWVLRSGAPWRDLPEMFGPYTTCYNRFVRWRRAGVWGRIIDTLAAAHDAAVQMIDTSIVRVHQHGACITRNRRQLMGRSRGGLTSKIHAVVDSNGLPVRLALSPGEAHDVRLARKLLSRLTSGSMLLADRGYDADWIRELAMKKGRGPTSRRKAIAAIRSASVRTSIALATRSNGSSTGSNNVVVWRRATTGLPETTLPSYNSHLSGYGWPRVMSPRPSLRLPHKRFPPPWSGICHWVPSHLKRAMIQDRSGGCRSRIEDRRHPRRGICILTHGSGSSGRPRSSSRAQKLRQWQDQLTRRASVCVVW